MRYVQRNFLNWCVQIFSTSWLSSGDCNPLFPFLKEILGYKVRDTELYQKAFIHRSMNQKDEEGAVLSFERLEYLGDSILSTVVAKFLYEKLPYENEGELTRMKSKIVSREKLNAIGKELKLLDHLICSGNKRLFGEDIHGNILEALIGASFVDKGYQQCEKLIHKMILVPYVDLEDTRNQIISYKSLVIEWGQKEKIPVVFRTEKENGKDPDINFKCEILVEEKAMAKVRELSKKKAEEKAAKRVAHILKIKRN